MVLATKDRKRPPKKRPSKGGRYRRRNSRNPINSNAKGEMYIELEIYEEIQNELDECLIQEVSLAGHLSQSLGSRRAMSRIVRET